MDNIKNINLEVPPDHLNFDLSTNVSLVLSKTNKFNPIDFAKKNQKFITKKNKSF